MYVPEETFVSEACKTCDPFVVSSLCFIAWTISPFIVKMVTLTFISFGSEKRNVTQSLAGFGYGVKSVGAMGRFSNVTSTTGEYS